MTISYIGSASSTDNNPTSGSWSLPVGWEVGDVAVFWWYTRTNTKTLVKSGTGEGVATKQDVNASGYGHIFIGYRVLQAEDSTFAWTSSSAVNSTTIWGTSVFRGVVQTGDPFEAESGAPATWANAEDPNPPSVTTVTAGAVALPIFGKNNDYTSITVPSGYATAGSNASSAGSDASTGAAYRIIASPGSEDPGAWDLAGGGSGDDGYVWTGALEPYIPPSGNTMLLPSDNFNDNSKGAQWDFLQAGGATVAEANQRVEIAGATDGWAGYVTAGSYDFTETDIQIDYNTGTMWAQTFWVCLTKVTNDTPWSQDNWYRIYVDADGTFLVQRNVAGGGASTRYSGTTGGPTYPATGTLRIVISGGNISFYYGATLKYTEAYGLSSYTAYLYFIGDSTDATACYWDNFLNNGLPTTGWKKLQYFTEPASPGWNKLRFASEPPVPGAWNKLLYENE